MCEGENFLRTKLVPVNTSIRRKRGRVRLLLQNSHADSLSIGEAEPVDVLEVTNGLVGEVDNGAVAERAH